jgi:hypothetical protein
MIGRQRAGCHLRPVMDRLADAGRDREEMRVIREQMADLSPRGRAMSAGAVFTFPPLREPRTSQCGARYGMIFARRRVPRARKGAGQPDGALVAADVPLR